MAAEVPALGSDNNNLDQPPEPIKNESTCWNSCWSRFSSSKWNPKNWELTSIKVIEYAAIILAACIVVAAVSAFISQWPQAFPACFAILGVIGFLSLIALIVSSVKYCQKHGEVQEGTKKLLTEVKNDITLKAETAEKEEGEEPK